MSELPPVAVVILNWNGERQTVEAVRSAQLLDYPNRAIIVIDNGSRRESVAFIRRRCAGLEIVETGRNLGYAGGNNAGLRLALQRGMAYALILNNDARADRAMLRRLVEAAEQDASLAILGPRIYLPGHPDAPEPFHWKIDWRRWLFHRVAASRGGDAQVVDLDVVQGCAMLVRTAFLRRCGLFDERYYLYCEDADLCVRARRAGYRTVEVPQAHAWHGGSASSGKRSALKAYYGLRNRLLFIDRHAPRRNRARLRAQLIVRDAGGQALGALGGLIRGDQGSGRVLRALAQAVLDWRRARYGPGPRWLLKG